jgi:hypothetical protein
MHYRWAPILGRFEHKDDSVIFKGDIVTINEQSGPAIGNIICDQSFGEGTISAEIEFTDVHRLPSCEIIVWFEPRYQELSVGWLWPEYSLQYTSFCQPMDGFCESRRTRKP